MKAHTSRPTSFMCISVLLCLLFGSIVFAQASEGSEAESREIAMQTVAGSLAGGAVSAARARLHKTQDGFLRRLSAPPGGNR